MQLGIFLVHISIYVLYYTWPYKEVSERKFHKMKDIFSLNRFFVFWHLRVEVDVLFGHCGTFLEDDQFALSFVVWWDIPQVGPEIRMHMTDQQLDSIQDRVKKVILGQKRFSTSRYRPFLENADTTATTQAADSGTAVLSHAPAPPPTPPA